MALSLSVSTIVRSSSAGASATTRSDPPRSTRIAEGPRTTNESAVSLLLRDYSVSGYNSEILIMICRSVSASATTRSSPPSSARIAEGGPRTTNERVTGRQLIAEGHAWGPHSTVRPPFHFDAPSESVATMTPRRFTAVPAGPSHATPP